MRLVHGQAFLRAVEPKNDYTIKNGLNQANKNKNGEKAGGIIFSPRLGKGLAPHHHHRQVKHGHHRSVF